jgi:predicted outer membrane protein
MCTIDLFAILILEDLKMKQGVSKFSIVALLGAGLLMATVSMFGQVKAGSPLSGENGARNSSGMSPDMAPNGPMAPQNNVAFTQQHVSETIRENMAMEIELSRLALMHTRNASIKKFSRQVIAENRVLNEEAKQFAPDKTGIFPNPMLEGTRQAVNARAAEKKMKNLTGVQFDRMYLIQMNGYAENDQQVGHSAYAMMEFPGISPVGRKMWDMANNRVKQIAALANKLHVELR